MTIQNLRKEDFYLPVLVGLDELGGSGLVEEIDSKVIEKAALTEDDLAARYPVSNALMVPHKIAFARSWDPLESTCRHASLSIL